MDGWRAVAVVTGCLAVAACEQKSETDSAVTDSTAMTPAPAAQPGPRVDTTAEALWSRLQQEDYTGWALWPGKEKFYPGQEPHGALLTTYVNALAHDALAGGGSQMPAGAIIVKENFGSNRALMATTVMQKVTGYDPAHHDWFWAKYAPDGAVQASGRVDSCYNCHGGAEPYDLLWTLAMEKTGKGPRSTAMQ